MTKFDNVILMADTANGVQIVDICDYPEADMLSGRDFLNSLSTLEDGKKYSATSCQKARMECTKKSKPIIQLQNNQPTAAQAA